MKKTQRIGELLDNLQALGVPVRVFTDAIQNSKRIRYLVLREEPDDGFSVVLRGTKIDDVIVALEALHGLQAAPPMAEPLPEPTKVPAGWVGPPPTPIDSPDVPRGTCEAPLPPSRHNGASIE